MSIKYVGIPPYFLGWATKEKILYRKRSVSQRYKLLVSQQDQVEGKSKS